MTEANNAFMEAAIALSLESVQTRKGGPYGAVVVKDHTIIGRGMNLVTLTHDPTAHAEMLAIREACDRLQTWQLVGCELYTSCEPCPMCLAAIYWARLDRVYYANTKETAAAYGFGSQAIYQELALPLNQRQLPLIQLLPTAAEAAFEAWANQPDKQPY